MKCFSVLIKDAKFAPEKIAAYVNELVAREAIKDILKLDVVPAGDHCYVVVLAEV